MVSLSFSGLKLLSSVCTIVTLSLTWALIATSFEIDESAASSSSASEGESNPIDLFSWARLHGAKIAESIEIKDTAYGGRGLFAKKRIPANTELVQIPYHLQLGIRQLAEGTDEEMQQMARSLPWEYIRDNKLTFVPLSIALIAERRKGAASSIFGPFLESLPQYCANSVETLTEDGHDDLTNLLHWAPSMADTVRRRRIGIQSLHETIAPSSVSMEDLRWAATNVCSRSLLRKRIKELTPDQVERIGAFSASDHSRMLPIIDLVNHRSLQRANVWVGHLSRDGGDDSSSSDTNDFSTSLKSTRDIEAGEELLFDYGGGGEMISNDRLLLDFGFVLPGHTDQVSISLEEFDAVISDLNGDRTGMNDVPEKDIEALDSLITAFLVNGATLLFTAGDEPSVQTVAIAIAMTCRGQEDVTRVLAPARQITPQSFDARLFASQLVESCTELQKEYARYALKRAAGLALTLRPSIIADESDNEENCDAHGDEGKNGFAFVAREYSKLCKEMLQRSADMSR